MGWIIQKTHLSIPWWVDAPAVLGFYGLFYKIFDVWLWRIPALKKTGLIKTPDLNGIWQGSLSSSYDNYQTKHDATMRVYQTWSHISISLRSASSESHNLSGMILVESSIAKVLSYEFRNEPKPHAKDTMHVHRGIGRFTLSKEGEVEILDGEYFTGRDRQTYGIAYFEKR